MKKEFTENLKTRIIESLFNEEAGDIKKYFDNNLYNVIKIQSNILSNNMILIIANELNINIKNNGFVDVATKKIISDEIEKQITFEYYLERTGREYINKIKNF